MKLIKYRDWGMPTHTYFWVTEDDKPLSPYFDNTVEAEKWLESTGFAVEEKTDKINNTPLN